MPRVLLISNNEICYNARLLKAADFLSSKNWQVDVFNAVTGIASEQVYKDVLKNRKWNIIENDISKRNIITKFRWFTNGLIFKGIKIIRDQLKLDVYNEYYLNKGLILRPSFKKNYDVIVVHLIDNLPFAVKLKVKMNALLVYDSQEYFVGQYAAFKKSEYEWVKKNEKKYINNVDILLSTTDVMLNKIIEDYQLNIPAYRVRNVPSFNSSVVAEKVQYKQRESNQALKLIWHGMSIYFNNRRGVHIILKAVANCKENVLLYLQGNFPDDQKKLFEEYKEKLPLANKVEILPSAQPDKIVQSLFEYDVGLTAELPIEENQELTSSNKLFDYIHAGLAVISSDAKGLAETIDEFNVGLKYEPGNVEELSLKIDNLARNNKMLTDFKKNSIIASKKLYWEGDYLPVFKKLKQLIENNKN